jgi:8-oxo-dGTP pyrophosphatase MutT (NUDIX family)
LLQTDECTHFVGGGVEPEDKNDEDAVRREVLEEVGFTDILSIRPVSSWINALGYRATKQQNQQTHKRFFEVVVNETKQVKSEIDEGKHTVRWVKKDEVTDLIEWKDHQFGWKQYVENSTLFTDDGMCTALSLPSAEAREVFMQKAEQE